MLVEDINSNSCIHLENHKIYKHLNAPKRLLYLYSKVIVCWGVIHHTAWE